MKQRHAQGFAQNVTQIIGWELDRLFALTPAQIGVHHIALNGAWPDNRHLYHQIVKTARLEPRQHRHLRPALNLEHANRIGIAEHLIDGRVFSWDRGQIEIDAVMGAQQIKRPADA